MMNRYMKYGFVAALLTFSAAALNGQNLKKDITVVHDYEPEVVQPALLNVVPQQVKRTDSLELLEPTHRQLNLPPTVMLTQLRPAALGDTLFDSSLRGYASLAFMLRYNLAVSAGYKFVDTDRMKLNAWLQFDGKAYKADFVDHATLLSGILRRNTGTVGVQMNYAPGQNSVIDASLAFSYGRYNLPVENLWVSPSVNKLDFNAAWRASTDKWSYGAGIGYNRFALADDAYKMIRITTNLNNSDKASEHEFMLKGWGAYSLGNKSEVRLDASWRYISASDNNDVDANSRSELMLNPVYRGIINNVALRLGLKFNAAVSGNSKVLVAPDINVTWKSSDYVKLYLEAVGRLLTENMAKCYYQAPYTRLISPLGFTSMPIDMRAGLVYGPRSGFRMELYGGYMTAADVWMPLMYLVYVPRWEKRELQGWYAGATVGYNYRNLVDVEAAYKYVPQNLNRGSVYDIDRARHCLDLKITVTPIKSVDFIAGWHLRADRSVAVYETDLRPPYYNYYLAGIGSISDIYIKALYRINNNWSVMAQGSNLLNRKYTMIGLLPAQGMTGLVGVSYKF